MAWRRIGHGLAFAAICLLLVLFEVWAFLRAPWGAQIAGAEAQRLVSEAIDGEIRVAKVGTFGVFGVRLDRALVLDPFDEPVIAVRELRVKLVPWRLLLGELAADVRVRGGRMALVQLDAYEDVNVGLAFAPEEEGEEEAPAQGPGEKPPLPPAPPLPITLHRLAIDETAFVLLPARGAAPEALVRDIEIRADGAWNERGAHVNLVLDADTLLPVRAPLAVDVQGAFARNWLDALGVEVRLGDSRIFAQGRGEMRALEGRIVAEGQVGAAEARAVGVPLAGDLDLDVDIWLSRTRSTVGLRAGARAGGVVAVDGSFDRRDAAAHLQVILADVDPARWLEGLPAGGISGSARARGTIDEDPAGSFELRLEPGTLAGAAVGPVALAGAFGDDAVDLAPSRIVLPGAELLLRGRAGVDAIDLRGALQAADLAAASAFAASVLGADPLPLGGSALLELHLGGSLEAPAAQLHLDAPRLRFGGVVARGLEVRAALRGGEALPAGTIAGSVEALSTERLRATALRFSAERAADGAFDLDVRGRARARTQARADAIHLAAGGQVVEGGARIDRFALDFPRGSLRSEGQARVDFGRGDFAVEDLVLRQREGGRLHVTGGVEKGSLLADLQGRRLRLEELPQALLPADAGGALSIDAKLTGRLAAPEGHARFEVVDGAWGALRDFAARGDVRVGGGRAAGSLAGALGGAGRFEASFDLPLDPMAAPPEAPVHLDLRAGPVDLEGLGLALGAELPRGGVMAQITAGGRIGLPDFGVDLVLSRLEIPDAPSLPALAARIEAELDDGMALVHLEGWAGGVRIAELDASAPLDPRRLRAQPREEIDRVLASSSSRASAAIRGLDLEILGALLDLPELDGAAAVELEVQGPIVDPRGRLRLDARGGPFGPISTLDLVTLVELLPDRSRLVAALGLDGEEAEVRAEVGAPLRAFLDGTAAASTPASLAIDAPALDLGRLGARAVAAEVAALARGVRGGGRLLGGVVSASARFDGTLASLPGSLRLVATDLVVRGVELGGLELAFEQDERASADLRAIDPTAGTLVARLELDRALSPLALARDAPAHLEAMHARLEAEGVALSLGPLATISTINRAGGRLDLRAEAAGPLATLDPVGAIAVREGTLELVGGPRYQDITVDARLTGERLVLARLRAAAPGRGSLVADGRLQRAEGPNPFAFEVEADAFPIGGPGGVAARISGEGRLEGEADAQAGVRATLEVPRAEIRLPRSPPRELQTISRPEDVVIVTGPEAFLRQRRRQLASREEALPLELRIDAPRRIFVVGEDLNAELGARLTVRRPGSGALLGEGEVRARRGQVRVLGRSFVVEEAAAIWGGGPLADPNLSLTARYQAADATAWVDVTGSASRPVISLRSDPPMPESQIALLIASGRTTLPGQTPAEEREQATATIDPAQAAVSVAGSFAARQLQQALGPRLPLDVLTLETAGEGARLEAGTFVSDRLYLGYLRNFLPDEDENRNEVRAEYELSRTVSLESRFGDRGAAGLDLVWEKRIATPAQQRARSAAREEEAGRRAPPRGDDAPAAFPQEDAGEGFEPEGGGGG